jgi:hypothetical protein
MRGHGQSDLIANLLFLPVAAIRVMLGAFDCDFGIREVLGIKRLIRQLRNGFFYSTAFNCLLSP